MPQELFHCDHLVLPGTEHFGDKRLSAAMSVRIRYIIIPAGPKAKPGVWCFGITSAVSSR